MPCCAKRKRNEFRILKQNQTKDRPVYIFLKRERKMLLRLPPGMKGWLRSEGSGSSGRRWLSRVDWGRRRFHGAARTQLRR